MVLEGQGYKHVLASGLALAIDIKDLRVLMVARAAAAWKQFLLSQFSNRSALHAPFDEFGSITSAAQFCSSAAYTIPSECTLRYFFRAVQDRADGLDGLTKGHCFRMAARMEMALRATKHLHAQFATRQWVLVLEELIMAVLLSLDRSLMHSSRITPVVSEI